MASSISALMLEYLKENDIYLMTNLKAGKWYAGEREFDRHTDFLFYIIVAIFTLGYKCVG